jgi:hypothetical protein
MTQSDVAIYLGQIQLFFGKDYSDDQEKWMRGELFKRSLPRQAYIDALKDIELIEGNFLPPPKDVIAIADRASSRLKPKEVAREVLPPADKLQAAMGMKLVGIILNGKATRGEILGHIRKANDTKPGTGWDDAGILLEKYYTRCNLDLGQKPANYGLYADEEM